MNTVENLMKCVVMLLLMVTGIVFNSCGDDDDDNRPPKTEVPTDEKDNDGNKKDEGKDNDGDKQNEGTAADTVKIESAEAGLFTVIDLSTGETVDDNNAIVYVQDTLKVTFTPNEEYKNLQFEVFYGKFKTPMEILADGSALFVVPRYSSNDSEPVFSLELSAVYKSENGKEVYNLSAQRNVEVKTGYYADITYWFDVYPDLMELVNTEFCYIDDEGKEHTESLSVEDFTPTMVGLYRNEDGKEEKTIFDPGEGWTKVSESVYCYGYEKVVRYKRFDMNCHVEARFKQKENIELTKDFYDLRTKLNWGRVTLATPWSYSKPMYINVDITIGDTSTKKENVVAVLNELTSKPLGLDLRIEKDGKINELKK